MKRTLVLLAVLLVASFGAQANLFTNASFESGNNALGYGLVNGYGQANPDLENSAKGWDVFAAIPGWQHWAPAGPEFHGVSAQGIEVQTNGVVPGVTANSGDRYIEMDSAPSSPGGSDSNTWTGQVVHLDPGVYEVSFHYMARPVGEPLPSDTWDVGLYLNGDKVLVASRYGSGAVDNEWTLFRYTFQIWSPQLFALSLAGLGTADGYGGLIDDVFLSGQQGGEIPEPATFGLIGAGLVGLYFARRRRA